MENEGIRTVNGAGGSEALLTAEEVARFMQVTKGTVYRWAKRGCIPSVKIGDAVRFSSVSLRSWLASQTSQVGGPR